MAYPYLDGESYVWKPSRKVLIDQQIQDDNITLFGYIKSVATPPTKLHHHPNTLEITYIVKGQQRFCTEVEDYLVFGGELFVMPPDILHSTGETPMEKQEMYWFHVNMDRVTNFLGLSEDRGRLMLQKMRDLPIFKFRPHPEIKELFQKALYQFAQGNSLERLSALSNVHQILLETSFAKPESRPLVTPEIWRVTDYLDSHLCDNVSLEQLADIACLSLSRFKERFRTEIGISPREYFNLKKIEQAKAWLHEDGSGDRITDIAMKLGFSSSAYFSVVFKKFTALTPSEYLVRGK